MRSERPYARLQPTSEHDLLAGQAIVDVAQSSQQATAVSLW
jgi:hypothetical protein